MSISTTVKTIQDIMRIDEGVDGDAQRISQLTWMIFIKVFDDRETEYEIFDDDYVSPLPDELRWRSWAADSEGITGDELLDFVNNQLFSTLKNLNLDEVSDSRQNLDIPVIYGVVTSGTNWRFLTLNETFVCIDMVEYYINQVDRILGIILNPIQAYLTRVNA
ncbi:MAG: type I restriction-modification system subunit M N-terminal domain-containing protein [Rivularia sp. (in: cyanobacteria)]|jgi:type I restriction enzyme M protein